MPDLFVFKIFWSGAALLMLQNFILNIFSYLFASLTTFLFDFSYFREFFLSPFKSMPQVFEQSLFLFHFSTVALLHNSQISFKTSRRYLYSTQLTLSPLMNTKIIVSIIWHRLVVRRSLPPPCLLLFIVRRIEPPPLRGHDAAAPPLLLLMFLPEGERHAVHGDFVETVVVAVFCQVRN